MVFLGWVAPWLVEINDRNLAVDVKKQYVLICRTGQGVIMLSHFTSSARSIIYNSHKNQSISYL